VRRTVGGRWWILSAGTFQGRVVEAWGETFWAALRNLWRSAISPAAIRRRRRTMAWYRSGLTRAAWEKRHGSLEGDF